MTHFAPVGPLVAQRALAEAGVLGNYQLLIAPVIIRQMEAYAHFYREDYPDNHIIIDNGVVELGYPLDPPQLYQAARIVNADVVVIPDTINDSKMTVKQARANLPIWRRMAPDIKALGVVQGVTLEECLECARILASEGVDWLGASKYSAVNLGSRIELVQALGEFNLPIHVLGFSDNMVDDLRTTIASPMVQGIDAATPVWSPKPYSFLPYDSEDRQLKLGRRPPTFWTDQASPWATHNVQMMRWWLDAIVDADRAWRNALGSSGVPVAPTATPEPAPPSET